MHPVEELPVARLARVFLPGAVRPMASVAGTVHAPKPVHRWVWPVVFALLALYAGMALTASMGKGVSFDEGEELAVGYNGWLYHDFRMEGANGDLVKRWATLPFLFSHPSLPVTNRADWVKGDHPGTDSSNWAQVEPYALGYQFFFQNGNQPGMLLLQGRVMIVLLGIATGLLVFYCSREIFGSIGGLVSLGLFVFSPHMLAFGGIVSTEMSVFLTLLGATWSIWRLLHRVTWGRLFASLGFVALLFLAKATALVIFPIAAVLVAVKIFSARPLEWRLGRPRMIHSRWVQAGIFGAFIALHGISSWCALWAHYDFRYAASPGPAVTQISLSPDAGVDLVDPSVQAFMSWCRRTHFLPEGYLDGINLLLTSNETRTAFMDGQWKVGGWNLFYPYAIWAKTSPVPMIFLVMGLGSWWWLRRRGRLAGRKSPGPSTPGHPAPPFYQAIPFVALIAIYLVVALAQDVNIAHRHILPIYPPVDILAGGTIGLVWSLRGKWMRTALALLMLWYVGDTLAVYPNFLAYFSPVVGGPAQGYQRLVDSSLDWGMNLPSLKRWLDQHNPGGRDPVYLAYFGTDSPDYYGIKYTRLPSYPEWSPRSNYAFGPGIYVISATLYQSAYLKTRGPWNRLAEKDYQNSMNNIRIYNATISDPARRAELLQKYPQSFWVNEYVDYDNLRFARLCAWLRHNYEPDYNVDHAILIWKLSKADLDAALYGPPAEMADTPVWTQAMLKFQKNPLKTSG